MECFHKVFEITPVQRMFQWMGLNLHSTFWAQLEKSKLHGLGQSSNFKKFHETNDQIVSSNTENKWLTTKTYYYFNCD